MYSTTNSRASNIRKNTQKYSLENDSVILPGAVIEYDVIVISCVRPTSADTWDAASDDFGILEMFVFVVTGMLH